MGILIRWLVTTLSVVVAAAIVPGIDVGDWKQALIAGAVLGLVNFFIKPLLRLLSLPLIPLTFGLILFGISVLCFWLASWISDRWFDAAFHVDGVVAAVLGALVVSVVTAIADWFLPK